MWFRCTLYVQEITPPLINITVYTVFIVDEIYVDWGSTACGSDPTQSPCITRINVLQVLTTGREQRSPPPTGPDVPAPLFFAIRGAPLPVKK